MRKKWGTGEGGAAVTNPPTSQTLTSVKKPHRCSDRCDCERKAAINADAANRRGSRWIRRCRGWLRGVGR